jgi:hypothetical protein
MSEPERESYTSTLPKWMLARLRSKAIAEGRAMNVYIEEGVNLLIKNGRL